MDVLFSREKSTGTPLRSKRPWKVLLRISDLRRGSKMENSREPESYGGVSADDYNCITRRSGRELLSSLFERWWPEGWRSGLGWALLGKLSAASICLLSRNEAKTVVIVSLPAQASCSCSTFFEGSLSSWHCCCCCCCRMRQSGGNAVPLRCSKIHESFIADCDVDAFIVASSV